MGRLDDLAVIDSFDPSGGSRKEDVSGQRLHVFEDERGEPVGYISVAGYAFLGFPYITFLVVHPSVQRRGIASRLLDHVEKRHSGKRLFISTESDNGPMLALLEKKAYHLSGALGGLNDSHSGMDEVFFYKDVQ